MCKYPKFVHWTLGENGKKIQHVLTMDEELFLRQKVGAVGKVSYLFRELLVKSKDNVHEGFYERPCGKCEECRINESKEWASRIVLESMCYPKDTCWFITLTYNDDNLPVDPWVNKKNGVYNIPMWPTLVPEHCEVFIDSLRKHYERQGHEGIRCYYCGEYGTKSGRPHYHFCFFNLPFGDKEPLKLHGRNYNGDALYTCDYFEKLWGKGFVVIAELNYNTAAYVARYCMKKQFSFDEYKSMYDTMQIHPVFAKMSTHPGIGREYFDKHYKKIYENDNVVLPGGKVVPPPRYFDKLYEKIEPDKLAQIKLDRLMNSAIRTDMKLEKTDLDEYEFFQVEYASKCKRYKQLLRTL